MCIVFGNRYFICRYHYWFIREKKVWQATLPQSNRFVVITCFIIIETLTNEPYAPQVDPRRNMLVVAGHLIHLGRFPAGVEEPGVCVCVGRGGHLGTSISELDGSCI